jgi:MFS family permease
VTLPGGLVLRALGYRAFALLWSGQTISRLGDSLYQIALAWWVLERTGSAVVMGTVLICSFIPMLLFLLVGGVAGDRLPRLRVMIASDLLRGGLVTVVTLLAATGTLEVWHIYIASVIFGFIDAFFQPAYSAMVPELLPAEALPPANSLTTLSRQLMSVAGPALGAAVIAAGGTSTAFGLDALSFFLSAICLLAIPASNTPSPATSEQESMLRDIREGLGTVIGAPWLGITIVLAAVVNITTIGPLTTALPFLVKDHLHADVDALGLIYALSALGTVLAALVLGHYSRIRRRGLLAYGAWMLSGLMILAFGLPVGLGGVAVAALVDGAAVGVFGLIWTNTLQELVPRDRLGRVSSIDFLGSFALLPVGYGLTGWATDLVGAPLVFVIGGLLTTVLVGLGLLHPAIRSLD